MPACGGVARARRRRGTAIAGPLVVGGHSAGGHLAAMMFATDWRGVRLRRASPVRGGAVAVRRARPAPARRCLVQCRPATRPTRGAAPCRRSLLRTATRARRSPIAVRRGRDDASSSASRRLLWDAWPDEPAVRVDGAAVRPGPPPLHRPARPRRRRAATDRATLALFYAVAPPAAPLTTDRGSFTLRIK